MCDKPCGKTCVKCKVCDITSDSKSNLQVVEPLTVLEIYEMANGKMQKSKSDGKGQSPRRTGEEHTSIDDCVAISRSLRERHTKYIKKN